MQFVRGILQLRGSVDGIHRTPQQSILLKGGIFILLTKHSSGVRRTNRILAERVMNVQSVWRERDRGERGERERERERGAENL